MSERMQDIPVPDPGLVEGFEVIDPADIVGADTSEVRTISMSLSDISPLLDEGDIRTVLDERDLNPDTPLTELTRREIDLAKAEAYYKLCDKPVGGSTSKDVDGSWSHSEGGWTVSKANLDMWYKKYRDLREKWGEKVMSKSTIRVHSRGMRVWPTRR